MKRSLILGITGMLVLSAALSGCAGKGQNTENKEKNVPKTMVLEAMAAATSKDPGQVLGKNVDNLLSDVPGGQEILGTNAEGTSLTGYKYNQKWFGLPDSMETSYLITSAKDRIVNQITINLPAKSDRNKVIAAMNSYLGVPVQGKTEQGAPSQYYAHWIRGGVFYDLQDYGDYMEVYLTSSTVENNSSFRTAEMDLIEKKAILIQSDMVDLNGDGKKEQVELAGTRVDDSGYGFFDHLYLAVSKPDGKPMMSGIPADNDGGYDPEFALADLTGDGNLDVLVKAASGGSGGIIYINAFMPTADEGLQLLLGNASADPLFKFSGKFIPDYKAELKLGDDAAAVIDLKDRKAYYDEAELYKDGQVVSAKAEEIGSPWVDGISDVKIVPDSNLGYCTLKVHQAVSGLCNADDIAYIDSLITLKDGKAQVLENKISPVQ